MSVVNTLGTSVVGIAFRKFGVASTHVARPRNFFVFKYSRIVRTTFKNFTIKFGFVKIGEHI